MALKRGEKVYKQDPFFPQLFERILQAYPDMIQKAADAKRPALRPKRGEDADGYIFRMLHIYATGKINDETLGDFSVYPLVERIFREYPRLGAWLLANTTSRGNVSTEGVSPFEEFMNRVGPPRDQSQLAGLNRSKPRTAWISDVYG